MKSIEVKTPQHIREFLEFPIRLYKKEPNWIRPLEKDIESQQVISNFEWPFTLQHTIYSFESPNLSSSLSATSFVGITEKKRFRFDAGIDLTWEFISDVNLQFSVYYNYDNKVLTGKTTKEDYGTVISLLIELK